MHHTDYSHNLRKTQHKTLKSLSTHRSNVNADTVSNPERLRAAIAALLVIIALFQMDPADASCLIPMPIAVVQANETIQAQVWPYPYHTADTHHSTPA